VVLFLRIDSNVRARIPELRIRESLKPEVRPTKIDLERQIALERFDKSLPVIAECLCNTTN
jgi:hypothetical protein